MSDKPLQFCIVCKSKTREPVLSAGLGRLGICLDCAESAMEWFEKKPNADYGYCWFCRGKEIRIKKPVTPHRNSICFGCAETAVNLLSDIACEKV